MKPETIVHFLRVTATVLWAVPFAALNFKQERRPVPLLEERVP
jgi:hypothetical protein